MQIFDYFKGIHFAQPWFFLLLLLLPFFVWFYTRGKRKKYVAFKISSLEGIKKYKKAGRSRFYPLLLVLRMLGFSAIVVAIARPQSSFSNKKVTTQGIDIVLAMDVSPSMFAIDFKPNRISAAKEAARQFVDGRPNDRIGLVVFAGESFTQCPITLDHDLLKNQINYIDQLPLEDATALGDGLFMAVSRLADTTQLNTKVIILLTDGVRNAGEFAPTDAASAAKQLNIRIYTIGIGSDANSPIPLITGSGQHLGDLDPRESFDAPTLQDIAETTGGKYFHATNKEKLESIYKEIDQIEKQKIEVNISKRYDEKFYPFAIAGIILLLLEIILANTVFRTLT